MADNDEASLGIKYLIVSFPRVDFFPGHMQETRQNSKTPNPPVGIIKKEIDVSK